ncbi:MarR family winged helix-turn-helix transcriptional regulator [Sphingomonas guangdongensis]|uniref:MarR family winged helix-turn-helix transcriptional regulator n=1 Tax=Sphingomonas guangdongensis TaxID=1141890 RepID=UPI0015C9F827|nr:MarR family winged helix-turn-helix transcriptional regulator [Sphingomonas guangdongensis]
MLIDPDQSYQKPGELFLLVAADVDGSAARASRRAVEASGARIGGVTPLSEAVDRLGAQAALDGVIVAAEGADVELLDRTIDSIGLLARERLARLIAHGGEREIDLLWARLGGVAQAILLDPAPIDIATAIALPRQRRAWHDVSRDEEQRLRQLDAEVARFAQTLARLSDPEARGAASMFGEKRPDDAGEVDGGARVPTAAEVRSVIRARRLRDAHFPPDLFADPAWDMLLDLYAAELEHRRVSVSSLCIAAAVPGTTALRWIGTMMDAGLFERHADQHDRRRAYVALTDAARAGLNGYFDAVGRAGLNPA